jgi:5'(3')-deoxyribonucleotidase
MIIVFDIDDVTGDMMIELVRVYNTTYGDWLCLLDITEWDITRFVYSYVGRDGFWALLTPELYDSVKPMPGAIEGIERLREAGHRVAFKTAANRRHPGRKLTWLMDWSLLPEDPNWSDDYMEVKDVGLIRADVLVTDNPHELEAFNGTAILYDRPWNQSKEWPARAQNWKDLVRMILDLAGEDPKGPEGIEKYYEVNPLEALPGWDWRQSVEFKPFLDTLERMGHGIPVTYQRTFFNQPTPAPVYPGGVPSSGHDEVSFNKLLEAALPNAIARDTRFSAVPSDDLPWNIFSDQDGTWGLCHDQSEEAINTTEGVYKKVGGYWYKKEPKPEPMPAWAALPLAADKPPEHIVLDGCLYQRSDWGGAFTANLPGEHFRMIDGVIYERIYEPGTKPNATIEGGALPEKIQATNLIPGIGPDAPATINVHGGRQSALPYRFDLVDPTVLFALAEILATGAAKYGEWNWRRIGVNDNLNHALSHIYAYLAGDHQDDHLGHAFCRLMFAKSCADNPDLLGLMEPKEPEAK